MTGRTRRRLAMRAGVWLLLIWGVSLGVHWGLGRLDARAESREVAGNAVRRGGGESGGESSVLSPDERRFFRRTARDGSRLLARRMESMSTEERMTWLGGIAGWVGSLAARRGLESSAESDPAMHPEVQRILREEFVRVFTGDDISPELRVELAPLVQRLRGPKGGERGGGAP